MFYVVNDVTYGNDMEGAIYLHDEYGEIVMWDIAEWVIEPSLLGVIFEAIRIGMTQGGYAIRLMIGKCLRCENLAQDGRDFCHLHY